MEFEEEIKKGPIPKIYSSISNIVISNLRYLDIKRYSYIFLISKDKPIIFINKFYNCFNLEMISSAFFQGQTSQTN